MKIKIITGDTPADLVTKVNHFFASPEGTDWVLHGEIQRINHYEFIQTLKNFEDITNDN